MKQIIEVNVKTNKAEAFKYKADILAIGLYSDVNKLDKLCAGLDSKLGGSIKRVLDLGDFKGKKQTSSLIYTADGIAAKRVLLVGLGEKKAATIDTIRRASALAVNQAVNMQLKTIGLAIHQAFGNKFKTEQMGQATAEGAYLGAFRYDEFVTKEDNGRPKTITAELVDSNPAKLKKLNKGVSTGAIIGRAQNYARTLANRPGNVINPETLASEAKKLTRSLPSVSCTILDEKQLATKKMGGILAIGSGSRNKPRLIILKYNPVSKAASKKPIVGLVGKAITFDSGGISIKPSAHMDQMKLDKCGGIAVIATIKAAAELRIGLRVTGIVPAAENLPSGTSCRPGDIVNTYNGKTVEIQNTDAEGRMILCDALAYAAEQKCEPIIDIATLTGACVVALGNYMAALMGNNEKLIKQLEKAGKESGERLWPMPSGEEYLAEMKSKIADLKNIGSKWGGACTAAAFLSQFVNKTKWAHIDMAGMMDINNPDKTLTAEGASGFGVRLFSYYLMGLAKNKT
jgi:leucyl aminopeptidase